MCFSATASFATAVVTGVIGVIGLSRSSRPREFMLAAMPIIFAIQQSLEGLLWLNLPLAPDGPAATKLTLLFLLLAEVCWPLYVPLMILLVEPNETRRRLMLPWLVAGVGVATYLLWGIFAGPHEARIVSGHIVYVTEHQFPFAVGLTYLAATCLPLLLSTYRALLILGVVVLTGCVTAYTFYWNSFVSVWCFFGAAASAVILFHFESARRHRVQMGV